MDGRSLDVEVVRVHGENRSDESIVAVLCVEGRAEIRHCVRDLLFRALEPATGIVVVVSSAEDALALLRSIRFDLVLSAYWPGRKILEYLRADRPGDVDRFVFFSGADEASEFHPKVIEKGVRVDQFVSDLRRLTRDQLPWGLAPDAGNTSEGDDVRSG